MVIDDLADRRHECDLLLDQNYCENLEGRYAGLVPAPCRKLLGPRYALLRPEFVSMRTGLPERSGEVRRILVFFGGVDPTNETEKAIEAFLTLARPDIEVDVVVGETNPGRREIERLCSSRRNLHFHCAIPNMAEVMAKADLAIGGGGVALLERCSLLVPTIIVSLAHNQLAGCRALARSGGAIFLGIAREVSAHQLQSAIGVTLQSPDLVHHMASQAGQVTDGRGAERVVRCMREGPLSLRLAAEGDGDAVWAWRNNEVVRRFSGDSAPIELGQHRSWYAAVISDENRELLIAEDRMGPVGVLRYDIAQESATVSVYLVPGREGSGLGTRVIREGEGWLKVHRPDVRQIRAEIRSANQSSIRAFAKAGFVPEQLVYVRNLGVAQS